jgi:hypothetical protein
MWMNGSLDSINNYIVKIIGNKWKTKLYFLAEWYRHWECGSGVIWRKSGIKKISLVEKLKTFNKIKKELKK